MKKYILLFLLSFSINCSALTPLDCSSILSNVTTPVAKMITNICNSYLSNLGEAIFIPHDYNNTIDPFYISNLHFFIFNQKTNRVSMSFSIFSLIPDLVHKLCENFDELLFGSYLEKLPNTPWANIIPESTHVSTPALISSDINAVNRYFLNDNHIKYSEDSDDSSNLPFKVAIAIISCYAGISIAVLGYLSYKYYHISRELKGYKRLEEEL